MLAASGVGLFAVSAYTDGFGRLAAWAAAQGVYVGAALITLVGFLGGALALLYARRMAADERAETHRVREARLEGILDQMPCLVWVTDRDLRITRALGGDLAHLDDAETNYLGRTLFEVFATDNEHFSPVATYLRALDGFAGHYDYIVDARPYSVRVEPLRDASGAVIGCISTGLDASERHEAEFVLERLTQRLALRHEELRVLNTRLNTQLQHQSILRSVTEAVTTSLDPALVAHHYAEEAGRLLGARAFRLYLTNDDGEAWKEVARGTLAPDAEDDALLAPPLVDVAVPPETLARWLDAAPADSLLDPVLLAGHPAAAAAPLRVGGRWIGVALWSRVADAASPTEEQQALLRALAAPVAAALQNALRHEQLRQMFYDNAAIKLLIDPAEQRIVDANAAAAAFYGYATDVLIGMPLTHLNASEPEAVETAIRHAAEGTEDRFVFPHRLASGDVREVEIFSNPVDVQGHRLLYSIIRDVTDEQQAKQALAASETRYRSLLDHLPVGVYRSTPSGSLMESNPAMAAMLGYEDVHALRRRDVRTLFADDADRNRLFERLGADGTDVAEYALRDVDDRRVWVRDYLRAIRDEDGTILYLDGVLVDVTEQKHAEAEIFELKAFYEAVLNALPLEVSVFDSDLRFLYVNPASVADESIRSWLIGRTQSDLSRILGRATATTRRRQAWLEEVVASGHAGRIEESVPDDDGEVRHLLRIAFPVRDGDGEVSQVIAYAVDLTERKRSEAQLLRAKDQAEEMARLKSAFLANMSHEIRTPLTGIIGLASVLGEELQHEQRELADLIKQSGQRLQETLNSVLDLARLEAGGVEIVPQRLDVGAEVEEAAKLFRLVAQDKGLSLAYDAPREPLYAVLDPAYLHRILTNLLSNAIKFTDEGTISATVTADDDAVKIEISDTGLGIAPAFMPHLFDEFKQESSGLARSHQGSGLGLAITKRLVDHMRGRITVDSRKGAGSRFTVTFPRAHADHVGASAPDSATADAA